MTPQSKQREGFECGSWKGGPAPAKALFALSPSTKPKFKGALANLARAMLQEMVGKGARLALIEEKTKKPGKEER